MYKFGKARCWPSVCLPQSPPPQLKIVLRWKHPQHFYREITPNTEGWRIRSEVYHSVSNSLCHVCFLSVTWIYGLHHFVFNYGVYPFYIKSYNKLKINLIYSFLNDNELIKSECFFLSRLNPLGGFDSQTVHDASWISMEKSFLVGFGEATHWSQIADDLNVIFCRVKRFRFTIAPNI